MQGSHGHWPGVFKVQQGSWYGWNGRAEQMRSGLWQTVQSLLDLSLFSLRWEGPGKRDTIQRMPDVRRETTYSFGQYSCYSCCWFPQEWLPTLWDDLSRTSLKGPSGPSLANYTFWFWQQMDFPPISSLYLDSSLSLTSSTLDCSSGLDSFCSAP